MMIEMMGQHMNSVTKLSMIPKLNIFKISIMLTCAFMAIKTCVKDIKFLRSC
jgi:hypothetical protein